MQVSGGYAFRWALGGDSAERILDSIPAQLRRPHKKFSPLLVHEGTRTRSLHNGLAWLFASKIAIPCCAAEDLQTGTGFKIDDRRFKCYLGDTGLLVSLAFDESRSLASGFYGKCSKAS